jgi:UDP-glucuronate 4-epimerase
MSGNIMVTGAAGFIGYHLSQLLLETGSRVIGIDNVNDYYDPKLKEDRLSRLAAYDHFVFHKLDIKDGAALDDVFKTHQPQVVVNLAAQAGVRYSIENPMAFMDSNVVGFLNVLEACRKHPVRHLLYASSSSVYGSNKTVPFSTEHNVDRPVSFYAATKKSNELMAHAYSHIFGIPSTGLRFFTVYGPWGRPDMAYFTFTKDILEGRPIRVFNQGKMERDFTYISDVTRAIVRLMERPPAANPEWNQAKDGLSESYAPYKIYNIGNSLATPLMRFVSILEETLGKKANIIFEEMQPGDVPKTCADNDDLEKDTGFHPGTALEEGLAGFVNWYKDYYGIV